MERLTERVHQILSARLNAGDVAIDATAGNGHDTLFLAQAVGPTGHVYAFDVQPVAIEQTRRRLEAAGLFDDQTIHLLNQSHAELPDNIPPEHHGQIAAVTFNLGYLPGADKSLITQTESTRQAVEAALSLLREEGLLTVVAYTGHPGGAEETETVAALFQSLSQEEFSVEVTTPSKEHAPRLFVVTRRRKSS
ncbi:MAG: class I SAM-dependent methyltransferase [Planctomycetaceae bacterium]|nr:class I SAM-dependent methyltransferase [Planctomycetaceae bacterium]